MAIEPPKIPPDHPDRNQECQKAIEDHLLLLFGEAVAACWDEDEVLHAIVSVADTTQMAMHQDQLLSMESELRKLFRKGNS